VKGEETAVLIDHADIEFDPEQGLPVLERVKVKRRQRA
jgi:hypothetical protein